MADWEVALQKFLKKWENRNDVIGALVCGSFVTGNPSKHSDIDVHIILDSKTAWRERGNEIIDGFLIEYFANPVRNHREYAEKNYKERRRDNPHMLCTGRVLFDKTGELRKLIRDSRRYLLKKYPRQSKAQVELAKYQLWDMCDNLEEVFEANAEEFYFVFYVQLKELFDVYTAFLRFDSMPAHQLKRLLVNKKEKEKYHIADFPDEAFARMYVNAIRVKDRARMMKAYQKLTKHVLEKMGGFNIDGWKVRVHDEGAR